MSIKKCLFNFAIAAGAFTLAACTDYDNGFEETAAHFSENFVDLFGMPDPNHDWNMAAQYERLCNQRAQFLVNGNADGAGQKAGMKKVRGSQPATEFGLFSYADNSTEAWDVPAGWTVTKGAVTFVTPEEMKKADAEWPEGTAKEKFASVNSYYISDGTPITFRLIWSQTDANNVIGVYDVEQPWLRLPVLANKPADFPNAAGLAAGSYGGLSSANNYDARVFATEYKINIPAGEKFGFYLERMDAAYGTNNGHGHSHFSESALTLQNPASAGSECDLANVVLSKDGSMLGFEDAHGTFVDYNDMVLHVSPSLIDNLVSVQSWIVACEDLGNADDIDFNDVVLEVSHTKDNTTNQVSIKPLAAGATLDSHVFFKDDVNPEAHSLGEIHSWMGRPSGTWINTQANYPSETYTSKTYNIASSDYSLASALSAGNLFIKTVQNVGEDGTGSEIIEAGNLVTNNVPRMIVVPGNWEWPRERTGINEAYPNFKYWVKSVNNYAWTTTKNPGAFIKRYERQVTADPSDPTPVDPEEDVVVNDTYGVKVSKNLTLGVKENKKDRYIEPSYFAKANDYVVISIVNSDASALQSGGFRVCGGLTEYPYSGTLLLTTDPNYQNEVSIKVTGDELAYIKLYGAMVFANSDATWSSGAQIFVKSDEEVGSDPEVDPNVPGDEPTGVTVVDGQQITLESVLDSPESFDYNPSHAWKYSLSGYILPAGTTATLTMSANGGEGFCNGVNWSAQLGKPNQTTEASNAWLTQAITNGIYVATWAINEAPIVTVTFHVPAQ